MNKDNFQYIGKILERVEKLTGSSIENRFDRFIDLDVCGANIKEMLSEPDVDFLHDYFGIVVHLVRDSDVPENSTLGDCFCPRCGLVK